MLVSKTLIFCSAKWDRDVPFLRCNRKLNPDIQVMMTDINYIRNIYTKWLYKEGEMKKKGMHHQPTKLSLSL